MPGSKRWPPLLIPQMPASWIRSGMALAIVGALVVAARTSPEGCGFEGQACNAIFARIEWLVVATLSFWIMASGVFTLLGLAHIIRVTVSWLRLDVLRH